MSLIGIILDKLQGIRDDGWDELTKETTDFCIKYNIAVTTMDDTIPARGRSRGHGCTMVTYCRRFRYEIFNVVHNQVLVELNTQFAEKSIQLLRFIAFLDPKNSFVIFDEEKRVNSLRCMLRTSPYMRFYLSLEINLIHSLLMREVIQIF